MNTCKLLVAGALLTPALVFGMNPDQQDRRQQQQQHGQSDQQRGQQATQGRDHTLQQRERHSAQFGSSGMDGDAHGFITRSTGTTISLENLIGSSARTSDNEEVGNVQDILIDSDGQAVAAIISVGGFLGMGQKDVAVSWRQVTVAPENDNDGRMSRGLGSDRPGAAGQSRMGTDGQARTGTTGQARTGTAGQDRMGTTGQARTGTTGQASGQSHDPSDYVLYVNVTEDALKDAPEFERTWD